MDFCKKHSPDEQSTISHEVGSAPKVSPSGSPVSEGGGAGIPRFPLYKNWPSAISCIGIRIVFSCFCRIRWLYGPTPTSDTGLPYPRRSPPLASTPGVWPSACSHCCNCRAAGRTSKAHCRHRSWTEPVLRQRPEIGGGCGSPPSSDGPSWHLDCRCGPRIASREDQPWCQ